MSARTMMTTAHTRAWGEPVQFDKRYDPASGGPISRVVWQDAAGELQETVINTVTDGCVRDFLVRNGVDTDREDLYEIERIGWARR